MSKVISEFGESSSPIEKGINGEYIWRKDIDDLASSADKILEK